MKIIKLNILGFFGDIDKNLAEELKKKLKKENISIASWITYNARIYINKE